MNIIDKIAWVYIDNHTLLSTKSKGKQVYYIPGGKREQHETDIQTLIREIREELNVEIVSSSIAYFGTFLAQADGHTEGVIVQMTCYCAAYTGKLKASAEIAEFTYLTYQDKDRCSAVDQIVMDSLHKKGLIC